MEAIAKRGNPYGINNAYVGTIRKAIEDTKNIMEVITVLGSTNRPMTATEVRDSCETLHDHNVQKVSAILNALTDWRMVTRHETKIDDSKPRTIVVDGCVYKQTPKVTFTLK